MTDKKPEFKHVNKESDLDKLVVGDLVRVCLSRSDKRWMVYEGIIDRKEGFVENFISRSLVEEDSEEITIFSWRIKKRDLGFKEGNISLDGSYKVRLYTPSSPEYQNAKELLEKAGLFHG